MMVGRSHMVFFAVFGTAMERRLSRQLGELHLNRWMRNFFYGRLQRLERLELVFCDHFRFISKR